MIHWAAHYLLPWGEAAINLQLDMRVTWKGLHGGHLADLPLFIFEALDRHHCGACSWPCWHPPTYVVMHMGENDLITLDKLGFKHLLSSVISECRRLLPFSVIVWSDILPRQHYIGAKCQSAIESKRKAVNKTAHALMYAVGGKVIKHAILEVCGQFQFTESLQGALLFFRRFPGASTYEAV